MGGLVSSLIRKKQTQVSNMNSKASFALAFALFLLFSSTTSAFNITRLLGRFPEFSSFKQYLTQTQLAEQINSRNTITVLVVDNQALASLSGKPLDVVKNVLSIHVVLDYYDVAKLNALPNKTALLTTLFQSSGVSAGQEGFVNASVINQGEVAFGSAAKGSNLSSTLVKSVAAQPYNISVLQISSPILPPGVGQGGSPTKPPPKGTSPSAAPKKSPATPPAKAPSGKPGTKAPAPAEGGSADSPAGSPSSPPGADSPPSTSPDADSNGAPATAPSASGSSPTAVAYGIMGVGLVMALVSSMLAF